PDHPVQIGQVHTIGLGDHDPPVYEHMFDLTSQKLDSPGYFSSPSGHISWEITVAEPGQRYRDGSRVRVVEAPGVQSKSKARRLPDGRWIAVGNRPIYTTRGLR